MLNNSQEVDQKNVCGKLLFWGAKTIGWREGPGQNSSIAIGVGGNVGEVLNPGLNP